MPGSSRDGLPAHFCDSGLWKMEMVQRKLKDFDRRLARALQRQSHSLTIGNEYISDYANT